MKKIILIGAILFALAPVSVEAKKPPQLTPLELQALQTKEFSGSKDDVFAAVMTIFQDQGYQVESADLQTGFITASSATVSKTGFIDALAGVMASGNTRVTAYVSRQPTGTTKVRLNFLNSRKASSSYGQNFQNDQQIIDPKVYANVWDKIDEALFMTTATNNVATNPASAQPSNVQSDTDQSANALSQGAGASPN